MNKGLRITAALVVAVGLVWSFAFAKDPDKNSTDKKQSLLKTSGLPRYTILNINNLTTWQRSDGQSNHSPTGADGMLFPRGTGNAIYQDNFVWGGKAYLDAAKTTPAPSQLVRVGGGTYGVGTREGWINGTGASAVRANIGLDAVRIYRIRRDFTTMSQIDLIRDAASYFEVTDQEVNDAQIAQILTWYERDWREWPVNRGAPYIERNGIPGYQAPNSGNFSDVFTVDSLIAGNYDEPGVAGSDPNSPANQVVWTAYNDLDPVQSASFVGSLPLGLEAQVTMWGYKRSDALGNLYFKRLRLINKGGVDVGGGTLGSFYIDSMFVCQWSDPDLGQFSDDLLGSDTVRSIGFVYNSNAVDQTYARFNLPPPAIGYDFLAGPLVAGAPGDSGVFDLKRVYGKKNLGMSSFAYFSAGSPYTDPPGGAANYANGTGRWWKMLRGFAPLGSITDADQPYASGPFPVSKFPLSGDPVAGTGWIDGLGQSHSFVPGDRRLLTNTGPFTLSPGDTQDIVMGVVGGLGADRLSSISVMKANDAAVQTTFNLLFQVSQPPAPPIVNATELDGQIIIEWGSNLARVRQTETQVSQPGTFVFEGYNVYQLPSAGRQISEGLRIATYDVINTVGVILDEEFDLVAGQILRKPVQFGTNTGVKRFFSFTRDYVRDINKLYNGQEYYYAVTAYSRSVDPGYVAALESSPTIVTARPKIPFGTAPKSKLGDQITVTRTGGSSDGSAEAYVISPTQVTGDNYEVRFDTVGATWRLHNLTKSTTPLTLQSNQTGDDSSPIVDGIQVKVFGAPLDFKDFLIISDGNGPVNPPNYGAFRFNASGFPSASIPLSADNGIDRPVVNASGAQWGIHTGEVGLGFTYDVFVSRTTQNGSRWPHIVPYDFEIRFTAAGGVGFEPNAFVTGATTGGTVINVPFELWRTGINTPNDPSDDVRLFPYLIDWNANGQWDFSGVDHTISGGDNDPETDWIYWVLPANLSPGQAGYNAMVTDVTTNTANHVYLGPTTAGTDAMRRMVFVLFNGGSVSAPTFPNNIPAARRLPEQGMTYRIISTKPNQPSDRFAINTSNYAAEKSTELEKLSIDRVGVFPNPYYAFNAAETNRFLRFVTFNNLPTKATVRIFNLAGQLVRTLDKDDGSQFLRWDLNNQSQFPVASGIYLAHLEMELPGDGSKVTKILKVAIIQEQEILDTY